MRILISSMVDLKKTAPNRLHHFVRYLSKKHEITAICINDWWKAELVDMNKYYHDFKDVLDNVEIKYITERKISPVKQEFFSRRILDLRQEDGYDVIFNYNTLISGHYIAKKLNIPMVYDLADDLPSMIGNSPQISRFARPFGKWVGKRALKRSINISKKVTGITKALQENYSIPNKKFELVPNGVDTELFKKMKNDLREDLGLENHFVLGYVGVLREWIDLQPVYQAIKGFENVRLLIVGEEGMLKKNKDIVKKLGIEDKVIFTGTVSYNKVPEYISIMDACLIPFKNNAISRYALPLKMFEYMACEKPVISTELPGVKAAAGNKVMYASNEKEWKENIMKLYKDEESRQEMGRTGREFVEENYNWEKIVGKIERILLSVKEGVDAERN